MKYFTIIALFIILPFQNSAQENQKRIMNKGDILLKFSPTSIIYVLTQDIPDIEFGASYFLENNLSVQLKYGKKIDIYNLDDEYRFDGFKISLEYKYFIKRRMYISIENGFIKNNKTSYATRYNADGEGIRYSYLSNDMDLYIVPKFGLNLFLTNRLIVDLYCGFGIQHRMSKWFVPYIHDPDGYIWNTVEQQHREYIDGRVALGMNISYKLRNNNK